MVIVATSILSEIPIQRLISVYLSFPLQNISFYEALIGNMYQDQSCFQVDVFLVTWCSCQDIPSSSKNNKKLFSVKSSSNMNLAWENSQHFAMPPLVSTWNDVWATSTEIPYWWCVTTQIYIFFPKLTLEAWNLDPQSIFVLSDYFVNSPNLFFLRCMENVRRK